MAYFWPRNTIMFEEGTAVHSVDALNTGSEFRVLSCRGLFAEGLLGDGPARTFIAVKELV
jgi:hypothetical protein